LTCCLAIRVEDGLVFAADSRTNAGVDSVTSCRKLHVFQPAADRVFVLLAAGSLATTRELIDQIGRDLDQAPNAETQCGKPILDRLVRSPLALGEAARLAQQGFQEIVGRLAPFPSCLAEATVGGDRGVVDVDEGSHPPGRIRPGRIRPGRIGPG